MIVPKDAAPILYVCGKRRVPPQPRVYCVPCLREGRKVPRTRTCDVDGCNLPLCDECAKRRGLPFDACPTRHFTVEGDGR